MPLNIPPATAPRTEDSIIRFQSALSKICGFLPTKFSAAILRPSCAPSVIPSCPAPLRNPLNAVLAKPGRIPDFSKTDLATAPFNAGLMPSNIDFGRTESKPAVAAPNIADAPGASCPVSR